MSTKKSESDGRISDVGMLRSIPALAELAANPEEIFEREVQTKPTTAGVIGRFASRTEFRSGRMPQRPIDPNLRPRRNRRDSTAKRGSSDRTRFILAAISSTASTSEPSSSTIHAGGWTAISTAIAQIASSTAARKARFEFMNPFP